jgi:hypothetical protein
MILVNPYTNEQFEVRAGLVLKPKNAAIRPAQVLSVNLRDLLVSIEERSSANYKGFPKKHNMAFDDVAEQYYPVEYAF